jgi:hypothetical protein
VRGDRSDWWATAALAILVLFLFRDALFGGRVFYYRDVHQAWHPQIEAFVRAVRQGSWPLWDRFPGFGQPLLADPAAQVLYPPTWLNLVLRPWTYYTLYVAGHVAGSAIATYFLARRCRLSMLASLVTAGCWMLSGPYLSSTDLWHHFAGASWMPVVLLVATRAFDDPGWTGTIVLGLAVAGQILAGSADVCAMTLLGLAGWAACRMEWPPWRSAASRSVVWRAGLGVGIGLGLAAALWVPVVDLTLGSGRRALPFSIRTYWSVHPWTLLDTIVPDLWSGLPLRATLRARLFDAREPFLSSLYLGLPTVALVGMGLGAGELRCRRFFVAAGLTALVAALGRHTPAYDVATAVLPLLRIFRFPVKAMIPVALCWAFLAGAGFDRVRQGRPVAAAPRVSAVLGAVALAELAAFLITRLRPETWSALVEPAPGTPAYAALVTHIATKLEVGAALAATASIVLFAWTRGWIAAPALALGVLAVGELIYYNQDPSPLAPKALYTHRPEVLAVLQEAAAPRVYVYDYARLQASPRYLGRSDPYVLGAIPRGWESGPAVALGMQMYLVPVIGGRWPGLLSAFDLDSRGLYPPWLTQLMLLLRQVEKTPAHRRLLQLGGVTHVLALHDAGFEDLEPRARIPGLFPEPIRVFRVPGTLPSAYAVAGARVATGDAAMTALLDPAFDPTREIVLPEGLAAPAGPVPGSVTVVQARPDRVRLQADLQAPGYVVLLEGFAPGWRARVDGRPADVMRANVAFRAVAVGAGHHVIDFAYRPPSVVLGLMVSAATAAALASAQVLRRRPRGGAHAA